MENVKKNFGFGCMRLPMKNGEVDLEETCRMVDAFLDAGFNYFDTAHGYISMNLIPCTACRYCTDGCPKHISIPDLFAINRFTTTGTLTTITPTSIPRRAAGHLTASSAASTKNPARSICPSANC